MKTQKKQPYVRRKAAPYVLDLPDEDRANLEKVAGPLHSEQTRFLQEMLMAGVRTKLFMATVAARHGESGQSAATAMLNYVSEQLVAGLKPVISQFSFPPAASRGIMRDGKHVPMSEAGSKPKKKAK